MFTTRVKIALIVSLKADLHGTTLSHATRLGQAYETHRFV